MNQDKGQLRKDIELVEAGKAILGIEFGSSRIKASLVAPDSRPLASGCFGWENQLKDGIWTYDLSDVWKGVAGCYASLVEDAPAKYSVEPSNFAAMGFGGMMHGYIALDKEGKLLTPSGPGGTTSPAGPARAYAAFGFRHPAALETSPTYIRPS